MKKINLILFLTFLLLSVHNIFAYDFFTKEIHKSFLYKENMKLNIINQYGNLSIIPVQQDSITIDITVRIEHYEEDKANKLLDEVDIDFSNINNIAKAKTVISHLFKTGLKFSVDYIVKMPSKTKLDIKNDFGAVMFEGNINNETKIDINYGKLFIKKIFNQDSLGKHIIKLNYSEAEIIQCDNLKLTSNYSKVKFGNTQEIIVASKFSKINLESSEYLIANCNHDTYVINKTKSTNILQGSKSDISINNLIERAEINLKEGNINIVTNKVFKYIDIKSNNVITNILSASSTPYIFNIRQKGSKISYPGNANIISSGEDEFTNTSFLAGVVGDENNTKSSISIKSTSGEINIK